MKTIRGALFLAVPALMASTLARGSSITVQFAGTSGVSAGGYYVLPYLLYLGGSTEATNAICYDFNDDVLTSGTWSANEYDASDAANYGQFAGAQNSLQGYETVAYLASYFFTGLIKPTDTNYETEQIDLQQMIWDVFDYNIGNPNAPYAIPTQAADPVVWGAVNDVLNNDAEATFNTAAYIFLEADPVGSSQSFVLYDPAGGGQQNGDSTPESGSAILLGIGVVLIGVSKLRLSIRLQRARTRN